MSWCCAFRDARAEKALALAEDLAAVRDAAKFSETSGTDGVDCVNSAN